MRIITKIVFGVFISCMVSVANAATYEMLGGSFTWSSGTTMDLLGGNTFEEGLYTNDATVPQTFLPTPDGSYDFGFYNNGSFAGYSTPVPTIDLIGLTADFTAMNITAYLSDGSPAIGWLVGVETTLIPNGDGSYTATWITQDVAMWGQTFAGGNTMSMTFAPVPVPTTVWLFSSGLLCLIGAARRKKA